MKLDSEEFDIEFRIEIIDNEVNRFIDYLKNGDNDGFDDVFDRKYLIDLKKLIEYFEILKEENDKEVEEIKRKLNEINELIEEKFF